MKSLNIYKIKKKWLFIAFLLILIQLLVLFGRIQNAKALSTYAGLYAGPIAVTAHNNFESWLGSPILYATDYVAYTNGWSTDFNPTWLYSPWSQWVSAESGRRLVLGVPMLENGYAGQFAQGSAGAFDSYFLGLGQKLVSYNLGSTIIRLGYEANCNTIGPWQATDDPSGYITDFRHIVGLFRSIPNQHFMFDWTVCSGLQTGHALTSFDSFYPGNDVVDIMGIDQYDVDWGQAGITPQQRWQDNLTKVMGLQDQYNYALAHNKPISIPEWGLYASGDQFAGGGDDPYYIDQMTNWIKNTNAYYQSYFNLNWGGGVLSDFPNGQAEYKVDFGNQSIADTTAPTVSLSGITNNQTINSTLPINISAADNVGVTSVNLYINNTQVASQNTSTLSFSLNPLSYTNGSYTITANAFDAAGNKGSTSITINISNITNFTASPTVTIVTPINNQSLFYKTSTLISASSLDSIGISNMQLYINGNLKYSTSSSSVSYNWTCKTLGSNTFTIKATDTAGNTGQSSVVVNCVK